MGGERELGRTLKGRLADVFVRALVDGALDELAHRLGNRATLSDPVLGRASTLSSVVPVLEKLSARFAGANYVHGASASGIDRDVAEGIVISETAAGSVATPIAVVAERRRLREIELRLYYAARLEPRLDRDVLLEKPTAMVVPQIVLHVASALGLGAVERILAAFEEGSRLVDPTGTAHAKRDGSMAHFLSKLGRMDTTIVGVADDGRYCFVEANAARESRVPFAMMFERGDTGLLKELRLYYEP